MRTRISKADTILDEAEALAQRRGYHGFSFRDVAERVGIKTASIHYHFPTKGDLGRALVDRYAERLLGALPDPHDAALACDHLLDRFADAFRAALRADGRMCLCGLLGAEVDALPAEVRASTRAFFAAALGWLEAVLVRLSGVGKARAQARARVFLAALEGGLLLARALDDGRLLETVIAEASAAALARA